MSLSPKDTLGGIGRQVSISLSTRWSAGVLFVGCLVDGRAGNGGQHFRVAWRRGARVDEFRVQRPVAPSDQDGDGARALPQDQHRRLTLQIQCRRG